MANTHETLTALFSDTADAIREMTGSTDTIVADTFPDAIRAVGLKRLITNDTEITPTGTYATSTYYNLDFGVLVSYAPNGDVVLTMKGGTTTSYESLRFNLSSAPDGVTMSFVNNTASSSGTAARIYSCVLHGITAPMHIALDMSTYNSSYDYTRVDITLTTVE